MNSGHSFELLASRAGRDVQSGVALDSDLVEAFDDARDCRIDSQMTSSLSIVVVFDDRLHEFG